MNRQIYLLVILVVFIFSVFLQLLLISRKEGKISHFLAQPELIIENKRLVGLSNLGQAHDATPLTRGQDQVTWREGEEELQQIFWAKALTPRSVSQDAVRPHTIGLNSTPKAISDNQIFEPKRAMLPLFRPFEDVGSSVKTWLAVLDSTFSRQKAILEKRLKIAIEEPSVWGVVSSLLLGRSAELPPDLRPLLTITGTHHLFAVSGYHLGLLVALVSRFFQPLFGRRGQAGPILGLATAYAWLVGMTPSITRALLCSTTLIVSRVWIQRLVSRRYVLGAVFFC